jgi:hypothetical protein
MSKHHVCPWWLGYLLASPIRRIAQDPHKILHPHVREGMTVLEPGPGMGFFTLELLRLTGCPSPKAYRRGFVLPDSENFQEVEVLTRIPVSTAASDTDPCKLERFCFYEETLQAACRQSYR